METRKLTPFKQALTQAVLEEQAHLMAQEPEEVAFSPDFQARVAALSRRTERKSWRWVNTAAKRALLAAVLALLLAGTVVAAVPELRAGLIRFFTHNNGVAYEFGFDLQDYENAPKEIQTVYLPTYIPDAFEEDSTKITEITVTKRYQNKNDNVFDYIKYVQYSLAFWGDPNEVRDIPEGATYALGIDSDGAEIRYEVVDGYQIQIISVDPGTEEEPTFYLWTNHEYFFYIQINDIRSGNFNTFVKLFRSIRSEQDGTPLVKP